MSLLKLYHRMPPPVRSLAATLRGAYLWRWRYTAETDRLVAEALERDHWTPDQWHAYREERLAYVLHRAATQVPYYREQWEQRRRRGDRAAWDMLQNWPILEKETLRANPRAFVADDCNISKMFHDHTSGTSGKPLDIYLKPETVRRWYALVEARSRQWYGVSRHDRWAILGGQLVAPIEQQKPPFWVWNAAMHQLYMSSYHLAPPLIPHYLDALQRYRIAYVWGYTSALHALAEEALHQGRDDVTLKVAITNAEPVEDYQREAISRAFHCPTRETYGMAEVVMAAGECEAGGLHLWPEVGWQEVVEGDQPLPPGTTGDLVSTGLLNADMPLVRYRIGDRGALAPPEDTCTCGRSLPLVSHIEGRVDDVLYTADGRRVGRLDPVFKAELPIREAQIVQEALDRVRVRYVPAPGFTDADAQSIADRLRERMGPITVEFEALDAVPRTSSGKFRAVVCKLPPEEIARVTSQARR